MLEPISVTEFIKHTWDDYKSPTTSTFDKKLTKCQAAVSQIEKELDNDRSELTKLKKSVRALYNSTNKHAQNERDIAENLERIGKSTPDSHNVINEALQKFAIVTKNLGTLIEDLSKGLHNSLQFPLALFLKGDIKDVKGDLRKPFDKSWKDYESKFTKLEKDYRKKWTEAGLHRSELTGSEVAEEMEKERKIFQLQMCMYLIKVNEIKTKKGVDLLGYLIEYYKAVKLFFDQGQAEVEKHQSFIETLRQQLKDIKHTQFQEKAELVDLQTALKNSMTGYKEPSSIAASPPGYSLHQLQGNKSHGSMMEGELLKKSEGMLKKMWQRRKCRIKDGMMSISHSDDTKDPVKLNLLTCQVKLVLDDPAKRCFDLVSSHGNRTYHFQADDEKKMEQWISVLSNAKEESLLKAFQDSSSSVTVSEGVRELISSIIDRISKMPGNETCCDCSAPDPKWLSTNLGVLICLECCGIHRNMGVHISRTQSLEIDQLGTSQLLLAREIGNNNFNEVLEARLGDKSHKPMANSPMPEREEFIKAKYVLHKFTIETCCDTHELQQDLEQAIQARDMQTVLQVYAEGLDLMTVLPGSALNETALHYAIMQDDGTALHVVDFIIQNSNLNSLGRQNHDGNTSLHLCAMLNKSECMKCLLRTKPDIAFMKNNAGQTALDIAVEKHFQLCAELLKAAMAGKKDVFEHINIEWDLTPDEDVGYSDDEIEKPHSRPTSIEGVESVRSSSSRDMDVPACKQKPRKYEDYLNVPGNSSVIPPPLDHPPLPPRAVKKPVMPTSAVAPSLGPLPKKVSLPGDFGGFQIDLDASSDKPAVPPKPRTLSIDNTINNKNNAADMPETPPPIPAPRKPKKSVSKRCEALFDCYADNEDELTFREGEVIILLREEEEEWWEGEIEHQPHRKGLFPLSFVKCLPD